MDKETMEQAIPAAKNNPLSKYFRQPEIYMKLPSAGAFWPQNSLDLPVTGEIPVYPMTARDEITLRTPDALMNGSSVVEVIHSCCPSITNAWQMPSIDVDAVLIGIRIASYGSEMNLDTACPKCNEENRHAVDLSLVLSGIQAPDYSGKLPVADLKIKLQPQAFFGVNRQNQINFEESKIMESLNNADLTPEMKSAQITQSLSKLVSLSIDTVADSTTYIELADGTVVSDADHIREFYDNAPGDIMRTVQEALAKINNTMAIPPQPVQCKACTEPYQIPLEFDYANFFGAGS
jgi:hypothetical protein